MNSNSPAAPEATAALDDEGPDDDAPDGARYALEPVLWVRDLDAFKAFADPLRLRILRAFYSKQEGRALSGKQLMRLLDEEGNRRLYYHLKLLEDAGLIRKAFTKSRGNLTEAYYTPVAARIEFAPEVLSPEGAPSPMVDLALAFIGAVRSDLHRIENAPADAVLLRHREVTLRPEEASAMRAELAAVLDRYEAQSTTGDDASSHIVTMIGYPSDDIAT